MDEIKQLVDQIYPETVSYRRHLHQYPELSFQEYETSKYIQEILSSHRINYTTGWVKTGVVAQIQGHNSHGKCIALRADMDALPIQEENTVAYHSVNPGIMHACGHDAHTAMLLSAAIVLNKLKSRYKGTVKFIFQPGEEKLPGGASLMIKEGVLENPEVEEAYAQHVYPDLPAGKIGLRKGIYMASTDEIYLTIKGKGGHAALPHKLIDPVTVSAHIITALQQVVSRITSPYVPAVLSFGKIAADGATNVIPDQVNIAGTFRTFDETTRNKAHHKIEEIATNIAKAFGTNCLVDIRKGYPVLYNDENLYQTVYQAAEETVGQQNIVPLDLRMTAEDFSYFSQKIPAFFFRLGTGVGNGLHTSKFNIQETALKTGVEMLVRVALASLNT